MRAVHAVKAAPEAPDYIPYALPWIGQEEIDAVVECLRSGWITTGPRVKEFEAEFAAYIGCRHAVAVNSCTAALHLAMEALDVGHGDEILVPTMTFAATAEVVRYRNAHPVLIDSDPVTLNIDVNRVAEYLERNCEPGRRGAWNRITQCWVRAVVPVHYGGLACEMDALLNLAHRYGLAVVEDCAHALPARYNGRPVGTLGDIGAFSFYANKTITTGEGGMLVTDDDEIADRARIMSLHGISRDAWQRYTQQGSWYYEIMETGFKYNLTDIAAAIGIVQLHRCDSLWSIRQSYAERYHAAFRGYPEIILPALPSVGNQHAWHLFPIRLNLDLLKIDRAAFIQELKARGIGASVHFIPLHIHPYYRSCYGYRPDDLPAAMHAYERLISLPLYPRMTEDQVGRVIAAVTDIVEHNIR